MMSESLSQSEVCVKARQKDSLMISLMVSQKSQPEASQMLS